MASAAAADMTGRKQSQSLETELGTPKLVVNELLMFVCHYRPKYTDSLAIRRSVFHWFLPTEVLAAKKILVGEFQSELSESPFITARRTTTRRSAADADFDDIWDILDKLEKEGCIGRVQFAAVNIELLPKYGPDEINLHYVVERHLSLDEKITSLTTELSQLKESLASSLNSPPPPPAFDDTLLRGIESSLLTKCETLQETLSGNINNLVGKFDDFANARSPVSNVPLMTLIPQQQEYVVDRSQNIVLFGVREDKNPIAWRNKVDEILKYILGRSVEIADLFRLGKFTEGKTRPILVQLRSVWDRRLILSACGKLKDYVERVFVGPDEPLEMRRKRTLNRMQQRAVRGGKSVEVIEGILSIDNVPTYSIQDGYIASDSEDDS